ncbi:MAG: hypothetical protein AB7E32_09275 [Desulfovibrio sp.]
MSLKTDSVADLGTIWGDWEEDVEYRPDGAETFFVSGLFDREYLAIDTGGESYVTSTQPVLRLRMADLPLEPDVGDRVVLDSGEYEVIEPQREDPGVWMLRLREVVHASS